MAECPCHEAPCGQVSAPLLSWVVCVGPGGLSGRFWTAGPVDELTALYILSRYFEDKGLNKSLVVVATDIGISKRARDLAAKLDVPLAIMEKKPKAIFLTDDASARLVAEQMGFKVHGTIGIIIRTIRRELMRPEQVLRILAEIPSKSSLHIRPSLLEKIVGKIKKEFEL